MTPGAALFEAGDYFEAHEVWEDGWRASSDAAERRLLQGLIQCAAAAIKVREGNWRGAATLTERAAGRLIGLDHPAIDVERLLAALRAAIGARDRGASLSCTRGGVPG